MLRFENKKVVFKVKCRSNENKEILIMKTINCTT